MKYKAPATKALPSLSTVGSADFWPKYLSSNESNAARAASLDACADDADVALADADAADSLALVVAIPAWVVAVDADPAAAVSDAAASPALVVDMPAWVVAVEADVEALDADVAASPALVVEIPA